MRISDWSSDVCSSDLLKDREGRYLLANRRVQEWLGKSQEEILGRTTSDLFDEDLAEQAETDDEVVVSSGVVVTREWNLTRSEEHTSELQSLMRISYAVFCLKKKNK